VSERDEARAQIRRHASEAKYHIELVLECLGWPTDATLSLALDRLIEIKDANK
jgi:hypothetical protein